MNKIFDKIERDNNIINKILSSLEKHRPLEDTDLVTILDFFGHQLPPETFVFWATKEINERVTKQHATLRK